MAAVPVTITGIFTTDTGSSGNMTLVGMASLTGLGVGGGPAEPPPGIWPGPGRPEHPIAGPPPGIWPSPGVPTHPIAGPPPGIWPSPGVPSHPIVIPPDQQPPTEGDGSHPSQPIYLPGESGPGGSKALFGVVVPGSGAGLTWFLTDIPVPPSLGQPKAS